MVEQFVTYLQSRSVGEGAKSIYQRFKKVIRYAIDHDVMLKDPCKSVTCKVDSQMLRKDVLSPEEIQKLAACHYDNENPNEPYNQSNGTIPGSSFNISRITLQSLDSSWLT